MKSGATVVGPKPEQDPGLRDYPRRDAQVKVIADELWGRTASGVTDRKFGKGRVIHGIAPRAVLAQLGVPPDFLCAGGQPDAFVDWIHRSTPEAELYYLVNRRGRAEKLSAVFRVDGRRPELWDPVTGSVRELGAFEHKDGRTSLPLHLDPWGSLFVVFRRLEPGRLGPLPGKQNFPEWRPVQELDGPWEVDFDPRWSGPGKVTFDKLEDWTQRPEDGIRYYSGTAAYRKVFSMRQPGRDLFLDLGRVKELARVKLNGRDLGVVWCHPWRVDVSGAIQAGENHLEIEVVNLWPNRLIGDADQPANRRVTRTNIGGFQKGARLLESGLLGPVTLQTMAR